MPDFDNEPKTDYSMKDGEKIKVNFKVKTKGKLNTATSGERSPVQNNAASLSFAPPPSAGRSRRDRAPAASSNTTSSNNNNNTLNFDF